MDEKLLFKKVLFPFRFNDGYHKNMLKTFIKVEYTTDGRLSISGVESPRQSGNCLGSCGQILMSYKEYDDRSDKSIFSVSPMPGWTRQMIKQLFDVWDRWHLNDMKAGCEHQTAEHWGDKKVKIAHLQLSWDRAGRQKFDIERRANEWLKSNGHADLTPEEQHLLNLPFSMDVPEERAAEFYNYYDLKSTESKHTGWLSEKEHPEGVLSKACPTCGYKYGSAWNKEDVPADVLDWLKSLPESPETPAWV